MKKIDQNSVNPWKLQFFVIQCWFELYSAQKKFQICIFMNHLVLVWNSQGCFYTFFWQVVACWQVVALMSLCTINGLLINGLSMAVRRWRMSSELYPHLCIGHLSTLRIISDFYSGTSKYDVKRRNKIVSEVFTWMLNGECPKKKEQKSENKKEGKQENKNIRFGHHLLSWLLILFLCVLLDCFEDNLLTAIARLLFFLLLFFLLSET